MTLVTASRDREPSLGVKLLADLEKAATHVKKPAGSTSGWKMSTPQDITISQPTNTNPKKMEVYFNDEVSSKKYLLKTRASNRWLYSLTC